MFRSYDYKCVKCNDVTKDVMVDHREKNEQVCAKCKGKLETVWLKAPNVHGMNSFGSSN